MNSKNWDSLSKKEQARIMWQYLDGLSRKVLFCDKAVPFVPMSGTQPAPLVLSRQTTSYPSEAMPLQALRGSR